MREDSIFKKPVAVSTDDARNDVNAVSEAGLAPDTGCFALSITESNVSRLLGNHSFHVFRKYYCANLSLHFKNKYQQLMH